MFQKVKVIVLSSLTSVIIFSCQKELNFETVPVTGATPCKTCSYIPWCQGSTYTYIDTTSGTGATSTQTINIIKDTTINGKVFQKFANSGADGYYNCTAGVSTIMAYNVAATGGTVTIEQTLLKANEAVGATWSNAMSNGLGQNVDYDYKIIGKGLSKTVLGVNYTNVIQVHVTISITVPVIGTIVMGESDYFYANNIGLIDNITFNVNPFGPPVMALHRVLQAYTIP